MSNNQTERTITVSLTVLPAMVRAMSIARNTAMMCSLPHVQKAMEDLRDQCLALCPIEAKLFDFDRFSEAMLSALEGNPITIGIDDPEDMWYKKTTYAIIRFEGRQIQSKESNFIKDDPRFQPLLNLFQEIAPMDALAPALLHIERKPYIKKAPAP